DRCGRCQGRGTWRDVGDIKPEGYTYSRSAFLGVDPWGRTASQEREDLDGAVARGLGPLASPRLARAARRGRQGPGDCGPSPSAVGAPPADRPSPVSVERPALPRRREPPPDAGDVARLPGVTPDRASLAPGARPTEVVLW